MLWSTSSRANEASEIPYEKTVESAVREFQLGHWSEALVLFQSAHALKPSARTLRGMGLSAFEARRYADSIRWLSESLAHSQRPLTPNMRREVESVLQRAERFVGSFATELSPESATMTVNGEAPVFIEGQLKLDPGRQRLAVRADGFRTVSKELSVRGGQRGTLRVRLRAEGNDPDTLEEAETEPLDPHAVPSSSPADEAERDRAMPRNWVPWTLVGAGGGLVASGVTLLGLAARDISAVRNAEGTGDEIQARQERVPWRSGWGFGLTAAGLASAGLGVAWLTLGWSGEGGRDQVYLSPVLGGVRLSGTF